MPNTTDELVQQALEGMEGVETRQDPPQTEISGSGSVATTNPGSANNGTNGTTTTTPETTQDLSTAQICIPAVTTGVSSESPCWLEQQKHEKECNDVRMRFQNHLNNVMNCPSKVVAVTDGGQQGGCTPCNTPTQQNSCNSNTCYRS